MLLSIFPSIYYLVHSRSPNLKVDCELSFVQGTPVTEAWRWAGPCLGSATPPPAQDTPMLPPSRRGRCQGAGACPGEGSCLWTGWGGAGPPPFPLPPQDRPAWRNGDCCIISISIIIIIFTQSECPLTQFGQYLALSGAQGAVICVCPSVWCKLVLSSHSIFISFFSLNILCRTTDEA